MPADIEVHAAHQRAVVDPDERNEPAGSGSIADEM
jgi:hypothetical protein